MTEDSKASSTATTPKESSRKIEFNRQGNTPPGHYSGASWETYERKKRPREDDALMALTMVMMAQSVREVRSIRRARGARAETYTKKFSRNLRSL